MIHVLIVLNAIERQKRMNNEKQKTLDDLVPPLELCKAARDIVGDGTALVWIKGGSGEEVQVRKVLIDALLKYPALKYMITVFPAPTLAELLEMIYNIVPDCVVIVQLVAKSGNVIYEISINTPNIFNLLVEIDANPATAALRLLMKVKGVEQ